LLLITNLTGAILILLHDALVCHQGIFLIVCRHYFLIVNELLGRLAELTLLLAVVVEEVLILHSFLGNLLQHVVTLALTILALHFVLVLFLPHCLL